MEKIIWTELLRNEVLRRIKQDRNILHTINRQNPNWIDNMLHRYCHLKYATEGKIEGRIEETALRGRRRKQLLDETRGNWNLKEKALDLICGEFAFEEAMDLSQGLGNEANGHGNNSIFWRIEWHCTQ